MVKIKTIRQIKNPREKKILLRMDFNVPIKNKRILDDYKIASSLATIRFFLRYKCKIIIISHLGRPKENKQSEYTLKPVASRLTKLLGQKADFIDDCIGFETGNKISQMKAGEIVLLENLRFYEEEEKNNKKFAKQLASLADIYVNNAFAVSHRAHASLDAITNFVPAYAGLLLEKEVKQLDKILNPQKPLISIVGGAKIATKAPLIKKLNKNSYKILVGGALANNFLVAHNLEVGKSLIDKESIKFAKKIKSKKVIVPIDVVVGDRKKDGGKTKVKSVNEVGKRDIIFDIGPETVKLYANFIKKAKTIVWNGPLGFFENKKFEQGTLDIAKEVANVSNNKALTVVGGGETIKALKKTGKEHDINWVSTAGGAMLTFLSGGKMPGIKKIVSK